MGTLASPAHEEAPTKKEEWFTPSWHHDNEKKLENIASKAKTPDDIASAEKTELTAHAKVLGEQGT